MAKQNNTAKPEATQDTSFLPVAIAEQFSPADGIVAQIFSSEFGHVDLTKIDLEFAERLATAGILVKKSV